MQYLRQKSHWTLSFVFLVPIRENTWPYSTAGVLRLILHTLLMYRKLQVSVYVCVCMCSEKQKESGFRN